MAASLYRCPGSCGQVMRGEAGHAYGCMCDALPLGSDQQHPFDAPPFGPQRPYYHDREHRVVEFPDDGRDGVEDLRDGVWIA